MFSKGAVLNCEDKRPALNLGRKVTNFQAVEDEVQEEIWDISFEASRHPNSHDQEPEPSKISQSVSKVFFDSDGEALFQQYQVRELKPGSSSEEEDLIYNSTVPKLPINLGRNKVSSKESIGFDQFTKSIEPENPEVDRERFCEGESVFDASGINLGINRAAAEENMILKSSIPPAKPRRLPKKRYFADFSEQQFITTDSLEKEKSDQTLMPKVTMIPKQAPQLNLSKPIDPPAPNRTLLDPIDMLGAPKERNILVSQVPQSHNHHEAVRPSVITQEPSLNLDLPIKAKPEPAHLRSTTPKPRSESSSSSVECLSTSTPAPPQRPIVRNPTIFTTGQAVTPLGNVAQTNSTFFPPSPPAAPSSRKFLARSDSLDSFVIHSPRTERELREKAELRRERRNYRNKLKAKKMAMARRESRERRAQERVMKSLQCAGCQEKTARILEELQRGTPTTTTETPDCTVESVCANCGRLWGKHGPIDSESESSGSDGELEVVEKRTWKRLEREAQAQAEEKSKHKQDKNVKRAEIKKSKIDDKKNKKDIGKDLLAKRIPTSLGNDEEILIEPSIRNGTINLSSESNSYERHSAKTMTPGSSQEAASKSKPPAPSVATAILLMGDHSGYTCRCTKSQCDSQLCYCMRNGVKCGTHCTCINCKNKSDNKIQFDIMRALEQNYGDLEHITGVDELFLECSNQIQSKKDTGLLDSKKSSKGSAGIWTASSSSKIKRLNNFN